MTWELFLTEPYFQRVLLTALIVAATAAVMGVFLVQRGMALFGDGVAHMAFAGIAIGFVVGWLPLGTAMLLASLGALGVQEVQRRGWARSDAALGIVYTASLALGVVLISRGGGVPPDIESYLFGSLLLAGQAELQLAIGTALVVLAALTLLWRPFLLLSFGEERAQVQGLPARGLNTLFTLLSAVVVVASVRVVGVLLISGLLIIPAATASRLARSTRQAAVLSVLVAATSVVVGLAVSATFSLASGATITLVAATLFVASTLVKR